MPHAYYNEIDDNAAGWLRELIARGHLPAGEVDTRSITDVRGQDLRGFDQCHFFAGIGGWPYALDLAGWTGPVWTGSCPCQPFSAAGKRQGTDDPRHLWPEFHRLIAECRPATVFGEQVASKDGREWLAGVRADLEALGYGVGAADLCAAGVGAPHIRQRLYWLADTDGGYFGAEWEQRSGEQRQQPENSGDNARMGDHTGARLQGERGLYIESGAWESGQLGSAMQADLPDWNGATIGLRCSDGARRASAEPSSFPLAYGVPARVGRLRGYGNAIVPQVAAEFVAAYMDA